MKPKNINPYWQIIEKSWDGSSEFTFNGNSQLEETAVENISCVTVDANNPYPENNIKTLDDNNIKNDTKINNYPHLQNNSDLYSALKEISRGGMGIIFEGIQNNLERKVAIKKLIGHSKEKREKFIAESKVTAFLDHPNIVPVYDIAKDAGEEIILIMKLVKGISWRKLLENRTSNDLEKHLQILLGVCNAIAFAHSKNIVHNDLKPENIMIGEFGEILVMDWGIAVNVTPKNTNDSIFHKSQIKNPLGTPLYMPPELAEGRGDDIGNWTDTYLLGAILHEIIIGAPPHYGKTIYEVIRSIYEAKKWDFHSNIPKELQEICKKSLENDPKNRYLSVKDFQNDIELFLQHRESIFIAQEANNTLAKYENKSSSPKAQIDEKERIRLYENFSQVIACFQQALKLWKDNTEASVGEKKARLLYAQAALENEDFGLAKAQVEELSLNEKAYTQLKRNILEAEEKQKRLALAQRLAKVSLLFTCIFIFRIGLVLILSDSSSNSSELSFINSNYKQLFITIFMLAISFACYGIFKQAKYHINVLINIAVFYEWSTIFLVSMLFSCYLLPEDAITTGIFPTVMMIAIFRLMLPYHRKKALWIGVTSACISIVTLFITKWFLGMPLPQEGILMPYIVQHTMISVVGGIVSQKQTNDLVVST